MPRAWQQRDVWRAGTVALSLKKQHGREKWFENSYSYDIHESWGAGMTFRSSANSFVDKGHIWAHLTTSIGCAPHREKHPKHNFDSTQTKKNLSEISGEATSCWPYQLIAHSQALGHEWPCYLVHPPFAHLFRSAPRLQRHPTSALSLASCQDASSTFMPLVPK